MCRLQGSFLTITIVWTIHGRLLGQWVESLSQVQNFIFEIISQRLWNYKVQSSTISDILWCFPRVYFSLSARVLAKKSNFQLNPIQLHFIARCISILSSVLYCPWNAPCVSWEEASFILDSLYIQWTGEDGLGAWGTERQQNEGKIQGCTQEQGQQKQSVAGRQLWATHVANMNYLGWFGWLGTVLQLPSSCSLVWCN